MGLLELAIVFQAVAKCSIHPNMGQPDDVDLQPR
jgi:hypothetical protein